MRAFWFWPGLLLVMVVGLLVRSPDLDGRALDNVERAHFEAAGLGAITTAGSPVEWAKQDYYWARRTLWDAPAAAPGVLQGISTRMATRAGLKVGFSRETALRLFSMILGAACIFLVALLLRSVCPDEPLVALTGAALAALQLGSVFLSRSGTGGPVAGFFLLVMIYAGWRLFRDVREQQMAALLGYGALIAVSSCLAFGFDPSAKTYGVILAVAGVLLFRTGPNGVSKWPWFSTRSWTVLIALAPLAALVAFGIGNGVPDHLSMEPFLHARFVSWPVLALAPLGLAGAFTRDMRWLIWLVLWTLVPALCSVTSGFHWAPPHAHYFTLHLMGIVLAAEGAGVLWGLARDRTPGALADAAVVGCLVWMGLVTWSTIHGVGSARLLVNLP